MFKNVDRTTLTVLSIQITMAAVVIGVMLYLQDGVHAENQIQSDNQQTWTSGSCTVTYDSTTGAVTVTGNGPMADYDSVSVVPWADVRGNFTSLTIYPGVTTVGNYAFAECSIYDVYLPNTVVSIGRQAFLTSSGFYHIISIPASVTSIGQSAFYVTREYSTSLYHQTSIYFLSSTWNITSIGNFAFGFYDRDEHFRPVVYSPNNIANGMLDGYGGMWDTVFTYFASNANTYNITVDPAGYGTVSPASVTIYDGTSLTYVNNEITFTDGQTVTATPAQATQQYRFAFRDWTFGNLSQTANFTRTVQTYTITFQTADANMGTVSKQSQTNVPYGTNISWNDQGVVGVLPSTQYQSAQPKTGFLFDRWDGIAKTPSTTTVTGNITAKAYFKIQPITVTFVVNSAQTGWGTVSPTTLTLSVSNTVAINGNVLTINDRYLNLEYTVTATPAASTPTYTYSFNKWTGVQDGGSITADTTVVADFVRTGILHTVTFLSSDTVKGTVSAVSVQLQHGVLIMYNDNGWVTTAQAQDTYCKAIPNHGYVFDRWEGVAKQPEYTEVTSDMTLTAYFKDAPVTVTIVSNNINWGTVSHGSVTVEKGTAISASGDVLTIGTTAVHAVAKPQTEQYVYRLTAWSGIPSSGTVTADVTVTAQFTQTEREYTITITSANPDYGTVEPASLTVVYGTVITVNANVLTIGAANVTATPKEHTDPTKMYRFQEWLGLPDPLKVQSDLSISAVFYETQFRHIVTIVSNNTMWGTVSVGSVIVDDGTSVTITDKTIEIGGSTVTAAPTASTKSTAYFFVVWQDVPTVVTADVKITAKFGYIEITASDNIMYGVIGKAVPWGANPFHIQVKSSIEDLSGGVFRLIDPFNTGVTINRTSGALGGTISSAFTTIGDANLTVTYTYGDYTLSVDFRLHYVPQLIITSVTDKR